MESTGIVRKLDHLGRFCIPKSLWKRYSEEEKETYLEILVNGDTVCLKKVVPRCALCDKEVVKACGFKNSYICKSCREEIKEDFTD